MYFDAVLSDDRDVLFNGTKEATVTWLKDKLSQEDTSSWTVYRGKDLRQFTVQEYLS